MSVKIYSVVLNNPDITEHTKNTEKQIAFLNLVFFF